MQLGYKRATGNSPDYWFGHWEGEDFKFIRVAVGLSAPQFDRSLGCAILIGELYRPSGAQGYRALDAFVGEWPFIENWLVVQRKQTQFGYLITEPNQNANDLLYQMHQLAYALDEIPLIALEAPKHALTEFARQKVNQMIQDGRFTLGEAQKSLEHQQEDAAAAIQSVLMWLDDNKPVYETRRSGRPRYRHIMGQI